MLYDLLVFVLYWAGWLYWMWFLFVGGIHILQKWDTLPWPSKVLGAGPVVYAVIVDVVLNIVLISVLFWELPKEWTMSTRFHRHQEVPGWRAPISRWVCQNLLNPFDREHC